LAFVVVPTVIKERDAAIDAGTYQPNAFVLSASGVGEVKAAHADGGNQFTGAAESAVEHVALSSANGWGEGYLIHRAVLLIVVLFLGLAFVSFSAWARAAGIVLAKPHIAALS
jgi:hypothetical protein